MLKHCRSVEFICKKSSCCFIKPRYLYFFSSDISVNFGFAAGAKLPFCMDAGIGSSAVGALTPQPVLRALFPMRQYPAMRKAHLSQPQSSTQPCPTNHSQG